MALRHRSSEPVEASTDATYPVAASGVEAQLRLPSASFEPGVTPRDWPGDESGFLAEVLRCHGLPEKLIERLVGLAAAPVHAARLVDRLAVAFGAHFHFLPLEDALAAPMLLYGMPGAGVTTLAAKLAARFDERQILVVSADNPGAAGRAQLEEYLDVLGLPLAIAENEAALRAVVAGADGRTVIVDTACGAPIDAATAGKIGMLIEAAGAQGTLVVPAAPGTDVAALAGAAAALGTRRMIVTKLDATRYIGAALIAADAGKLAFVAASVTPHFAFGLRILTPENLARRVLSAAIHAERWRVAPL